MPVLFQPELIFIFTYSKRYPAIVVIKLNDIFAVNNLLMKNLILALLSCFFKFACLITYLLLTNVFKTSAQTGVLDVTFGNKGKVVTSIGDSNAVATSVVIQPDKKIIVGGYTSKDGNYVFALIRYNNDGSLDNTFGTGGKVTADIGRYEDVGYSIALQPDGKILMTGDNGDFTLIRYTVNGITDSTFGNNGIVVTDLGGYDESFNVKVKPDGKILVCGTAGDSHNSANGFTLVQYTDKGLLDSTFGINGIAKKTNGNAYSMAIQDNGKVLLGGGISVNSNVFTGSDFNLIRFNSNGTIDTTFGNKGQVITDIQRGDDIIHSIVIQSDGKIVCAGETQDSTFKEDVGLVRYDSNGTIDSTFGVNGKVLTAIGQYDDNGYNVILEPNGRMIVPATTFTKNFPFDPDPFLNGNFALLRYNVNGTLDSSFGKRGIVITDFSGYDDEATNCALQADGKIIVVGESFDGSTYNFALARYEQNAFLYYNTIKGSVFIDNNLNGIKDNEPFYSDAKITITKAGQDTIATFSNNGKFSTDIDTGLYVTKITPYVPYYNIVPASFNTDHATYFNTDSVSFALQPIAGKQDLKISLIPVTPARPGSVLQYRLAYRNQGTTTIPNATIQLVKSSKLNFLSASFNSTSQNGDTLRWEYSDVQPWETGNILINFQTGVPPSVNNNDTLRSVATIFPVNGDVTPSDNVSSLLQRVVGSYDPNDKTESHAGTLSPQQVSGGDYLTYTIRFQNTGTDTAFNVYVKDTLSGKLDWSTLQMVSWSHNYQLTVNDNNKLSWAFNNIDLVDSNRNEPSSHGYIVYRIKSKTSLAAGDTIKNKAGIYFDYNLPVATNIENTLVQSTTLPVTVMSFTAKREGQNNILQWSTTQEVNIARFEIERSTDGRMYTSLGEIHAGSSNYTFTDKKPAKAINYYRLKMIDKDGKFEYSVIRTLHNIGSFEASIYPNPVHDMLSLKLYCENRTSLQFQIIDMEGKALLTKQADLEANTSIKTIDVSAFKSGNYFVKITSSAKEQWVLKFEKL